MNMCLNRLNLTKSFVVLCFIGLLSICVFSQNYQAVGMKLDSAGNIFVVGKRYTTADDNDVLLVKYNASGIQLWAQFYNGPDGKNDEPTDIDIDDGGNIYICGKTLNTASNYDYLTLKYSNDGQLLWAKKYNGPAAYIDEAKGIVVNRYGSVYVTGTATNLTVGSDDDDIMTIKYATDGSLLWTKSYSGSPDDKDVGVDIGIDSTGNVYVTGYSLTASNYEDYVLIKYTNTGTQSWVKTYNGAGGDYDLPTKLFVDENDNIYVTGYSYGGASGEDWATLNYDVNGNLQWEKRYNGTGDGNDRPSSIAVDSAGGVYIAGYSDNFPTFNDMTTVKYNSAGTQLWINKFDGPISYNDEGVDVAVYNNNVFVFGKSYGSTSQLYDYVLKKLDLNGNTEWLARYNKGNEDPVALAIDDIGNIYVTGSTLNGSNVSDLLTIRYNQDGQEIWIKGFIEQVENVVLNVGSGQGLPGDQVTIVCTMDNAVEAIDWGFDLKFDSNQIDFMSVQAGSAATNWAISGNEVTSGVVRITGTVGASGIPISGVGQEILKIVFLIKGGATGNVPLIPETGTGSLFGATLKNGNITVGITGKPMLTVGSGSGQKGDEVTILITLDNVAQCSAWQFDLTFDTSRLAYVKVQNGSAIDDWNNITGALSGQVLTVSGTVGSGTVLTGSGFEIAKITFRIGQEASGVIFLIPSNATDGIAGATLNSGQITVELTMGYEEAIRVALDDDNNVYAVGLYFNEQNQSGILTVKYDNDGNELWTRIFDINTPIEDVTNVMKYPPYEQFRPFALSIDNNNGFVYIAAIAQNGEPGHDLVTDYFLLRYDLDGNLGWDHPDPTYVEPPFRVFNGFDFYYDDPVDMDLDEEGSIYITGKSWDPGAYHNTVTIKYDINGGVIDPNTIDPIGNHYPDPIWCARYSGESSGIAIPMDEPTDMVVKFGAVYVVGNTFYKNQDENPAANDFDAIILKYDKDYELNYSDPNDPALRNISPIFADRIPMFWKDEDGNPKRADDFAKKVDVCENNTEADIDYDIYVAVHSMNAVTGDYEIVTVKYPDYSNQLPPSPAPYITYDNKGIIIPEQEPTLNFGPASGKPGEQVTVSVTLNNANNCTNWGFDLAYDTAKLTYIGVANGTATSDWDAVSDMIVGNAIRFSASMGSGTPVTGSGQEIAKITFEIQSDASGTAILTPSNGTGYLSAPAILNSGSITINRILLTVGSGAGSLGNNVTISIDLANIDNGLGEPLDNWGFDLIFNPSVLTFVSAVNGDDITDWNPISVTTIGVNVLRLSGTVGSGTPLTGNASKEIVKITFQIKPDATGGTASLTAINLQNDIVNADNLAGEIIITELPVLKIGTTFGQIGRNVAISITVDNAVNIGGDTGYWEFELNYDKAKLNFVSIEKGAATLDWSGVYFLQDTATGIKIRGDKSGAGTPVDGSGQEIAVITFEIASGNIGEVIPLTPVNPAGDLSGALLEAGSVTISASAVLKVGTAFGPIGSNVAISITVHNAVNIGGDTGYWEFELNYDKAKLNFVSVEKGAATLDWSVNFQDTATGIRIKGDAGTPVDGSGQEIAIITFEIISGNLGEVIPLTPVNPAGDLSGALLEAGSVTVSAPVILQIGSGFGKPGDTLSIPVTVSNISGCTAFTFEIEYDPSRFVFLGPELGPATSKWVYTHPVTNEKIPLIYNESTGYGIDRIKAFIGYEGKPVSGNNKIICRLKFEVQTRAYGRTLIKIHSTEPDEFDFIHPNNAIVWAFGLPNGVYNAVGIDGEIIIFWAAVYDGPALSNDEPFDLELVPPGNPPSASAPGAVYVTGRRTGTDTAYDYVTLKYCLWNDIYQGADLDLDINGWVAAYNAPKNDTSIAVEYADLANVKVIVTGYSYLTANDTEFMTIGYDYDAAYNANREEWRANYGSGKNLNQPADLVLDEEGNAYIAGKRYTAGSSGYDFVVLKYNNNGELLWERIYGSSGTDNWTFKSVIGDSTGANLSGVLTITYNNTSVYSYWQRPVATNVVRLEPDTLYKADVTVLSSATGSTVGSYPDFRLYAGTYSGTGNLYFVSSFLSNGGANYISPKSTGTEYSYYFEPTGLTPNPPYSPYPVSDANLVFQFEGFNFPSGGRPDLVGTSIGLNRFVLEKYSGFDVNEAGASVHTITSSIGFAIGSGTANGWSFSSPTIAGNARATGSKAVDNQGLVIKANPMGTNNFAYGAFDANPFIGTNLPSFGGGTLYRATFNITTDVTAGGGVNIPMPQVRIQTGDSHLTLMASTNSLSDFNKIIGPAENPDNYIDLWFYYPNTRTAGSFKENKLFPSFEFLAIKGMGIPDGASITLRDFWLTAHTAPTP